MKETSPPTLVFFLSLPLSLSLFFYFFYEPDEYSKEWKFIGNIATRASHSSSMKNTFV